MTITYYFVENLSLASLLKAYFEIKYKRVDDCKKYRAKKSGDIGSISLIQECP